MRHFYIVQKYYINALALCQLRKSCINKKLPEVNSIDASSLSRLGAGV
jgi:hypothetical protein